MAVTKKLTLAQKQKCESILLNLKFTVLVLMSSNETEEEGTLLYVKTKLVCIFSSDQEDEKVDS
jgi:hypothetical protein